MSLEQKISEMIVRARDDTTLEMEVRFGTSTQSGFVSIVNADVFKALLKSMDAGRVRGGVWTESSPIDAPQVFVSFYFENGVRSRYFTNHSEHHHVMPVDNVLIDGGSSGNAARVALKRERKVQPPSGLRPLKVRLHRRWSFSRARSGGGGAVFRYDLTEVATGADVASAKDSQSTYELEIEIINTTIGADTSGIARSLLCKIKQLL
jgi:hypothetical protein